MEAPHQPSGKEVRQSIHKKIHGMPMSFEVRGAVEDIMKFCHAQHTDGEIQFLPPKSERGNADIRRILALHPSQRDRIVEVLRSRFGTAVADMVEGITLQTPSTEAPQAHHAREGREGFLLMLRKDAEKFGWPHELLRGLRHLLQCWTIIHTEKGFHYLPPAQGSYPLEIARKAAEEFVQIHPNRLLSMLQTMGASTALITHIFSIRANHRVIERHRRMLKNPGHQTLQGAATTEAQSVSESSVQAPDGVSVSMPSEPESSVAFPSVTVPERHEEHASILGGPRGGTTRDLLRLASQYPAFTLEELASVLQTDEEMAEYWRLLDEMSRRAAADLLAALEDGDLDTSVEDPVVDAVGYLTAAGRLAVRNALREGCLAMARFRQEEAAERLPQSPMGRVLADRTFFSACEASWLRFLLHHIPHLFAGEEKCSDPNQAGIASNRRRKTFEDVEGEMLLQQDLPVDVLERFREGLKLVCDLSLADLPCPANGKRPMKTPPLLPSLECVDVSPQDHGEMVIAVQYRPGGLPAITQSVRTNGRSSFETFAAIRGNGSIGDPCHSPFNALPVADIFPNDAHITAVASVVAKYGNVLLCRTLSAFDAHPTIDVRALCEDERRVRYVHVAGETAKEGLIADPAYARDMLGIAAAPQASRALANGTVRTSAWGMQWCKDDLFIPLQAEAASFHEQVAEHGGLMDLIQKAVRKRKIKTWSSYDAIDFLDKAGIEVLPNHEASSHRKARGVRGGWRNFIVKNKEVPTSHLINLIREIGDIEALEGWMRKEGWIK